MRLKHILLLLLLLLPIGLMAQNMEEEEETEDVGPPPKNGYRYALLFEVHAPHLVSNPANARAFKGIAGGSLQFNVKLAKNFHLGLFARVDAFSIYASRYIIDSLDGVPINSNPYSITTSGGLSLGYEVRMGERFMFYPNVNAGVSWIRYSRLICDKYRTLDKVDFSVNLNLGFYYYVKTNKRFGIGLILGGTYFNHQFSKTETCINKDGVDPITDYSDNGPTVHLNIGFGIITKFTKIRN